MKVINSDFLVKNLVKHPYESNPSFKAKINTFYFSEDKKAVVGYWEAPVGWFDTVIEEQSEINYVIEGEIELISDNEKIIAKKGDCFLVENGEKIKWVIKEPIKTIFFIYPTPKKLTVFFKELIDAE